jgi:hypothetical protein
LLYRGKDIKAEKALNKIHGQAAHHEMIVQEQLAILNKSREEEAESSSGQSKWSDLWSMLSCKMFHQKADLPENPVERRKLIATVGILVSQQISGVQFIFSYTTTFFTLVGLDDTFVITVSTAYPKLSILIVDHCRLHRGSWRYRVLLYCRAIWPKTAFDLHVSCYPADMTKLQRYLHVHHSACRWMSRCCRWPR